MFISIVNCFIYTFYISVKFLTITLEIWNEIEKSCEYLNQTRANIPTWHSNKFSVIDCPIQTSGAFYYFVYCSTSILECQSKDLKKCWIFFIFVSFCLSNHSIYLGAVVAKAKVHLSIHALVMNEGWIFFTVELIQLLFIANVLSTSFWYHFIFPN